ncbi:hypothetical protein [Alicyclobacillus sp. ALC3]|uniref:hypothetical protein n=1 Tax=Alicyclobacillus sp. ALC3 TaxID=2796143 RepID=UPI002378B56A|nr:hypothetical protein [Alicyclobacillus sp. ALC3]WDL98195.1 hypothetical protein JC200_05710 [Alicyclobacillus sp. ALC3]
MSRSTLYFGAGPRLLDWSTLEYRWFGVVWWQDDANLQILKYRFETSREALRRWMRTEGCENAVEDSSQTARLYRTIRKQQQERDWSYRKTMPFLSVFQKPWKDVELGWYAICSKATYPFVISAAERKKLKVTAHHLYICEDDEDVNSFIARVNQEREIHLRYLPDAGKQ